VVGVVSMLDVGFAGSYLSGWLFIPRDHFIVKYE
jgi:hypothetical protein